MGPDGASSASGSMGSDVSDGRRRAVPSYARPRDGRPTTGSATERRFPPIRGGGGNDGGYYYDPYYRSGFYNRYPYGYFWPGYGYGFGYMYDPWLWGGASYYDPYYYGGGYSGGGGYGSTYYGGYRQDRFRPTGAVRLKVKPNQGQVYVDGYYVGEVDSFDGVFQRLSLEEGPHRIEIRAPGFEAVQFEVMVVPGETVTYKGDLRRIQ